MLTSTLGNTHQCHRKADREGEEDHFFPLEVTPSAFSHFFSGIWFVRLPLALSPYSLSFPLGPRAPVSETKMLGDPVSAVSYGLRLALFLFILHGEPSALAGAPATVSCFCCCPKPVRLLVFSAHKRFSLHHPTQMAPSLGAFYTFTSASEIAAASWMWSAPLIPALRGRSRQVSGNLRLDWSPQ